MVSFSKSEKITLAVLGGIVLVVFSYTVNLLVNKQPPAAPKSPAESALATVDDQAPFTSVSGEEISLEPLVGQILVVNTWASWSPYSVQELPQLVSLAEEYAAAGVKIVAINRAESRSVARRYLQHLNIDEDDLIFVLDSDDRFYGTIEGYTVPETMFYDRSGNIVHHARGSLSHNEMRSFIEKALAVE